MPSLPPRTTTGRAGVAVGLVAAVLATATPAAANIVNVQGALAKAPEAGWSGQASASLDWRTGNTDLLQVAGGATVLHSHGRWLEMLLLRGEIGQAEDVRFAEKTFEHARVRVALDARWMWEAYGQHEYDAFRRLQVRAVAGTGPAVRLLATDRVGAVAGVSYLFEYEHLDDRVAVDAGDSRFNHRLSTYLTGTYKIDDRLAITETLYAQPRVDELDDARLLTESELSTQVTDRIALKTTFVLAYDASPPAEIETLDTTLKTTVTVSF